MKTLGKHYRRQIHLITICLLFFSFKSIGQIDYAGTEFWINSCQKASSLPSTNVVRIIGDVATLGNVSIPGTGFSQDFCFNSGGAYVDVFIPFNDYGFSSSNTTENTAIHITADNDVLVIYSPLVGTDSDNYLAIPTSSLGTDYAINQAKGIGFWNPAMTQITATENGTNVTISNPTADLGPGNSIPLGTTTNITLNIGESYRIESGNDSSTGPASTLQYSGTRISANNPVFLSSSLSTNLPSNSFIPFSDQLRESLIPLNNWGNEYYTASYDLGVSYYIQFVSVNNANTITMNGINVATIDENEIWDTIVSGTHHFTTNFPVGLIECSLSQSYNGIAIGDPSAFNLLPVSSFETQFNDFHASFVNGGANDLDSAIYMLTVNTTDIGSVTINGTPISTSVFTPIGTTGYSNGIVSFSTPPPTGQYLVFESPSPMMVYKTTLNTSGSNEWQHSRNLGTLNNSPNSNSYDSNCLLGILCDSTNTPTAIANAANISICEGDIIELTANTVAGGTYSWWGPNGFTSNLEDPIISGATSSEDGTYSLTISNGVCTSDTVTVDINVNPIPSITANAVSTSICEGENIELLTTSISGGIYAWTGPGGFTSSSQNPILTNVNISADGIYNVSVIVNGCQSTISFIDINVTPSPTAIPGIINSTICSGQDLELTANSIPSGSYNWSGPNGFVSSDQNPTINNAGVTADGTYTLTISSGACTSQAETIDVTVNETPVSTAGATSTDICQGDDILLTANTISGASYNWTGPGGIVSSDQNPIITNATSLESGIYSLVISANGCSSGVSNITINVNPLPTLVSSTTNITCNGLSDGTISVTPSGSGPFSFVWSPSGSTSPTLSGLSADSYTVIVTDGNGCEAAETTSITEPTVISVSTSSTPSQCTIDDGTATVVASGGEGTYSYEWTPTGQTTATATGIGAGNYEVTVTDGNGCVSTATITVPSLNGPVISIINQEMASCFGTSDGSATIEATGGTPGYSYSWSPAGGTGPTATGLAAGDYEVEVTDDAGCTALQTVSISEPNILVVSASITDAECGLSNGAVETTVSGGIPTYSFEWSPGGSTSATLINLSTGIYELTVTDNNGCQIVESYEVNLSGTFAIDITPSTATIDAGNSVNLDVILDAGITGENYNWSPTNGLSCITCPNPIASPLETTTYYLTVITEDGCSSTDSIQIFVNQACPEIYVPTIFSPNGDLNNDFYCIYGGCIDTFSLQIFNRWGQLIFSSMDPEKCWDGSQNGKPVGTGVYVYKLNLTRTDGEEFRQSGNINLVR